MRKADTRETQITRTPGIMGGSTTSYEVGSDDVADPRRTGDTTPSSGYQPYYGSDLGSLPPLATAAMSSSASASMTPLSLSATSGVVSAGVE